MIIITLMVAVTIMLIVACILVYGTLAFVTIQILKLIFYLIDKLTKL